jgi:hypothetical protein
MCISKPNSGRIRFLNWQMFCSTLDGIRTVRIVINIPLLWLIWYPFLRCCLTMGFDQTTVQQHHLVSWLSIVLSCPVIRTYWEYNLISTCTGECDWLFHWQHKLCATFSANVNINYRLPIKVYYPICTLRHIRIEINHGSQNGFWVLTWIEEINHGSQNVLGVLTWIDGY